MTGGSLGQRTGSYGSLQLHNLNGSGGGGLLQGKLSVIARKSSGKMLFSGKDKPVSFGWCRYLGRRKVSMLLLVGLAFLVFVWGSFTVNKESPNPNVSRVGSLIPYGHGIVRDIVGLRGARGSLDNNNSSVENSPWGRDANRSKRSPPPFVSRGAAVLPSDHPCKNFALPPPPPPALRRSGPRPCPVCYLPVEQAIATMPSSPSTSPFLQNLAYVHDENPMKKEPHGGSGFGGYPSLQQRNDSYDIKESMTVHCGFVKGSRPGHHTGFDIDEAVLTELGQPYDVIVASAIFGNYDIIQHPKNISDLASKNVPFFMFIDEETEAYMKNTSVLDTSMRVGLWRMVVVRNVPYTDARRNGKVPKLLLHRLFPNVRYSIWIDGKLELIVDPYQILERFLWRQNANFAISRHYRRFDVFVEAEANKAAGKYDNKSIDDQVEFYKKEGLTPYSEAKLPLTSDVPEGCVIIKEHIPITNLFTCLWFNEVDRFTSRDQISFSTVRDKIMSKVDWSINMFMDCERRNFVIQAYHRDLLEHMSPPLPLAARAQHPPAPPSVPATGRRPGRKIPPRHGRERRSGSRRHRKAGRENTAS